MIKHTSVLLNEVIRLLNPKPGENFIDCTIGIGGHAKAILEKTKSRVLGIDADIYSLEKVEPIDGLILAHGNFKDLKNIVDKNNFSNIHGVLFDLGLSSWQIKEGGKGFSFQKDELLDMRIKQEGQSAAEIIRNCSEQELTEIFIKYGEEKYSRSIAKAIKKSPEPVRTTGQLRKIIESAAPRNRSRRGQVNRVLARIFQALRIVVNDELENLKQGLEQAMKIVKPGGRIIVISFHSLEDRIVKNFFREGDKNGILKILTKKPIIASEEEIKNNPRSRSAKLRAIIKL